MLTSVTLTQYCYLRDKLHILHVFFRLLYFPLCIPKTCQSGESDTLNYPRGMKKGVCLTLSGIICIINRQPDKWISSIHLRGKAKSLRSQLCGKRKDAHNPMSCFPTGCPGFMMAPCANAATLCSLVWCYFFCHAPNWSCLLVFVFCSV